MTSKRDLYYDALKGLLIILVLIGHFGGDNKGHSTFLWAIEFFIYIFHMPLFIYISGYFSQNMEKNKERAVKSLIMFAVCQIVWAVFAVIILHDLYYILNLLIPGATLWYLIALSFYRSSLSTIIKIRYIFVIAILVAILVMFTEKLEPLLGIPRIIGFLPFFLLGFYSNSCDIISKIRKIPLFVAVAVLVMIFVVGYFSIKYFGENVVLVLRHNFSYGQVMIEHKSVFIVLVLNILSYALAIIAGCCVMRVAMKLKENNALVF